MSKKKKDLKHDFFALFNTTYKKDLIYDFVKLLFSDVWGGPNINKQMSSSISSSLILCWWVRWERCGIVDEEDLFKRSRVEKED